MGCRGCYGPLEEVDDQGARFLAALASIIDAGSPKENEHELERKIGAVVDTLADPAGTFYRFGLAGSFLSRARSNHKNGTGNGGVQ
jgi:F420-non-reducing hydrogenase small subunit